MTRQVAWILVGSVCIAACQRGPAREIDAGEVSDSAIANVTVIRNPTVFTCEDHEASLSYDRDSLTAVIDGQRWLLKASRDSVGRYTTQADSGPVVWRTNDTTRIALAGTEFSDCMEQSKQPFEARGNEPGWVLRIVDSTITYIGNYGTDTVSAPIATASTTGNATTYSTADENKLTAVVRDQICLDGATGMPHPYTVTVKNEKDTVNGCGGEPSSLLTGQTWTVSEIGGAATTGSSPTMTFTINGNVSGTTSCNRYSAPYRLAGEGLTFGPAVATKMACAQPVMQQELGFLELLARVTHFEMTAQSALKLLADNGQAIVAQRQ